MYTLAIDTGKHLGAALLDGDQLVDVYYQHDTCFQTADVKGLARTLVAELLAPSGANPAETEVVIEVPSHRYFGRGNASAVLKAMWQGVRLFINFQGKVARTVLIPADQWNKQRGDKQKKFQFERLFPYYKDLPYYQDKHGSRSNPHERDASLLGLWWHDTRKLSRRAGSGGTSNTSGE